MQETLDSLAGKVQQRVGTLPGILLIRDWLASAFRDELVPYSNWSWRRRSAALVFNATYSTGLATVVRGERIVNFTGGTAITDLHVGRQLRIAGYQTRIVTITRRVTAAQVEIDQTWTSASLAAQTFEIYNAYQTVPDDFDAWLTVVDLTRGHQLDWWSHSADSLDRLDGRRAFGGDVAWLIVMRDYAAATAGIVSSVVQARGIGNRPVSGGSYSGVSDSVFTIEMTAAGVFKWKRDNGGYTVGVAIDADGIPQALADGVTVAFPNDVVYTSGDIFSISAKSVISAGMPRYEAWPHIKVDEDRPYLYLAKPPDLTDDGALIPPYVKPGYLIEKALAAAARWRNKENQFFDLKLSLLHEDRAQQILLDMEREDQNRECTDLWYDWSALPVYDSTFLQGHDLGYEIDVLE